MAKVSESDSRFIQERTSELREAFKDGKDSFCVLRHVSKSGMQRAISFFYIQEPKFDGTKSDLVSLDYSIQKICGYKFNRKHGGLTVNGCGMDMGFSVVANLEYKLFGNTVLNVLSQRWI